MKKLTSIFIGLLYCIVRLYALPDIEGCDVGITFENSTLREFSLNQFTRNVPKSNEILRTKMYFNGKYPAISIAEKVKQLVFGYNHKNPDEFGIYETHEDHEDWMNAEKPCHFELMKNTFSNSVYTELDLVLKKDGKIFVIIHGTQLAVICETSVDFSESDFKILIGYAGNKEKQKFFYDCPMRKI